jgi:glycosyltransferase involved in cell wall biosynthesis
VGKTEINTLILTNKFPPSFDGVGHYSDNLYHLLKMRGIKVGVVTTQSNVFDFERNNQADVFPIAPNWSFKGCYMLLKIINQKQVNNLLIQYVPYSYSKSGVPFIFVFFLVFMRMKGIKIHTNFHEIAIRFSGEGFLSKIRSIVQRTLAYLICSFSNSIQTSNSYYKSLLMPFQSKLIPIPSNFEKLILEKVDMEFDIDNIIVIAVNANRCNNNFFEVIYELKKLSKKDFKIIVIGRAYDDDLAFIEKKINELSLNTFFQISVNATEETFINCMKNAKLYIQLETVMANKFGGVSSKSGTIATAMQLGIPIITTCGDMTDTSIFRNGINVCFVDYNDALSTAQLIDNLSGDLQQLKLLRKSAITAYHQYFKWEHTINYYLQLVA